MADDRIVYRFEGDSRDLTKALAQASREMKKTGAVATTTSKQVAGVGVASKGAAVGVATLSKSVLALGAAVKTATIAAAGAGGAFLAVAVAVAKVSKSMADAQNDLSDLSSRTGVATKTLAGLKLAAEGSGQNLDGVAKALKPLVLRLGQVKQGSKTAIDGFKAVGVEVLKADGKLRSADDVLIEITKNLADMKDPTERAAAAALAFGSAGTKLVQALGDEDLATFIDAAERFGMDVGPEAAKAAADWQRAFANLKLVLTPFSSDLMKFTTGVMRDFSLGFVFVKTLLEEIASFTLPELINSLDVLAHDAVISFLELRNKGVKPFADSLLSVSEFLSQIVGNDLEYKQLKRTIDSWNNSAIDFLKTQRKNIESADRLPGAFEKALQEARAFFLFSKTEAGEVADKLDEIKPPDAEDWKEKLKEINFKDWGQVNQDELDEINKKISFKSGLEVLKEDRDQFLTDSSQMFSDYGDAFGNTISLIVDNLGNLTKGQRAALLALYRMQQAAAITSIAIDTAQAVMKTVANVVPPLNIPAGIAVGLLGATQAAAVAAAPPPFHTGGIIPAAPGKQGVMINALPGESVLNRETTARLGADGVNGLNSGQGGGGMVIEMVYKHRIFDAFVADNLAKGGPLKQATKQGRRVGHRNGR